MSSEEGRFVTNDGVSIAYDVHGHGKNTIILLHGWGGSREHYYRNIEPLSKVYRVYRIDYRFHGVSDQPTWGHFVCRLASDLHDFVQQLQLKNVGLVGVSMGCSVIWAYCMLFGTSNVKAAVFVDQSPLQDKRGDWNLGSTGCYDAATLHSIQEELKDLPSFAKFFVRLSISSPVEPEYFEKMEKATIALNGDNLGRLMADHTQIDWRPVLPSINIPCLNVIGGKSAIFPNEGTETVTKLMPNCRSEVFPDANHYVQIDEHEKFNTVVIDFFKTVFAN